MAGKSDALEAQILKLLLNGTALASVFDNAASAPLTNLYVGLHTADPTDAGTQTSNEIAYAGYARVAIARSPGSPAWTIAGTSPCKAVPNATITFPPCTAGAGVVATHFSIGTLASGAGEVFYAGAISPTENIANGVTPTLTTATEIDED